MGGTSSKPAADAGIGRAGAITGGAHKGKGDLPKLPADAVKAQPENHAFLEVSEPPVTAAVAWAEPHWLSHTRASTVSSIRAPPHPCTHAHSHPTHWV